MLSCSQSLPTLSSNIPTVLLQHSLSNTADICQQTHLAVFPLSSAPCQFVVVGSWSGLTHPALLGRHQDEFHQRTWPALVHSCGCSLSNTQLQYTHVSMGISLVSTPHPKTSSEGGGKRSQFSSPFNNWNYCLCIMKSAQNWCGYFHLWPAAWKPTKGLLSIKPDLTTISAL